MELYFEEYNFDGFIKKLEPRYQIFGICVKEDDLGQRSAHFYGLDGHIIEVCENMKAVVKRFLIQVCLWRKYQKV